MPGNSQHVSERADIKGVYRQERHRLIMQQLEYLSNGPGVVYDPVTDVVYDPVTDVVYDPGTDDTDDTYTWLGVHNQKNIDDLDHEKITQQITKLEILAAYYYAFPAQWNADKFANEFADSGYNEIYELFKSKFNIKDYVLLSQAGVFAKVAIEPEENKEVQKLMQEFRNLSSVLNKPMIVRTNVTDADADTNTNEVCVSTQQIAAKNNETVKNRDEKFEKQLAKRLSEFSGVTGNGKTELKSEFSGVTGNGKTELKNAYGAFYEESKKTNQGRTEAQARKAPVGYSQPNNFTRTTTNVGEVRIDSYGLSVPKVKSQMDAVLEKMKSDGFDKAKVICLNTVGYSSWFPGIDGFDYTEAAKKAVKEKSKNKPNSVGFRNIQANFMGQWFSLDSWRYGSPYNILFNECFEMVQSETTPVFYCASGQDRTGNAKQFHASVASAYEDLKVEWTQLCTNGELQTELGKLIETRRSETNNNIFCFHDLRTSVAISNLFTACNKSNLSILTPKDFELIQNNTEIKKILKKFPRVHDFFASFKTRLKELTINQFQTFEKKAAFVFASTQQNAPGKKKESKPDSFVYSCFGRSNWRGLIPSDSKSTTKLADTNKSVNLDSHRGDISNMITDTTSTTTAATTATATTTPSSPSPSSSK